MAIKFLRYLVGFLLIFLVHSCHKKNHPESSKTTTATVKKKVKPKVIIPKVISVNDSAARKTSDGRYYYDLQGKRYWKNKIDGKYYLYNKSMYGNPAFKGEN